MNPDNPITSRALLVGVLFTFGLGSPIFAASLLSNPGFESDPAGHNQNVLGWQRYGPNDFNETDPTIARSGTNYFRVYQAGNGVVNYSGVYQDYISGPGAIYSADGWAFSPSTNRLAGQNQAWIEVTFRDAVGTMLALYRSAIITTNSFATGEFSEDQWNNLPVTNQYNPATFQITNTVTALVAPAGTFYVRYQVLLQGDAGRSPGSVFFDDLNLTQPSGALYGNMNIVWNDEFEGAAIKTNIWTYDTGAGGWGNNELENYTSRTNNAFVADGLLHIVARRESFGGANYTSARLKSQGLFSFTYGRLEWRAQFPQGVGFWPALWMLGTNFSSLGWPGCGEIDVMENNGSDPLMAQGSIHSGSDGTAIYSFSDGLTVTNFNTYTLDWTTNAILFYVNGHLYQSQTGWGSSTGKPYPFPFNQPFFLLMNLAIGGNYLGNPSTTDINNGTVFPGAVLVDYVRVYNLTDPLRLAITQAGPNLFLVWPSNIVSHVEVQTNSLGTAWALVTNATTPLPVVPTNDAAFFRLKSP